MKFTDKQKKLVLKYAKRVTKLPGNQTKGDVLDMVLVADCALLPEEQNEAALDLISFFRKEGGAFKNPRINLVKWKSDDRLDKSVISFPNLMIGLCLDKKDFTPDDTTMLWVDDPASDNAYSESEIESGVETSTEEKIEDSTDESTDSIVDSTNESTDSIVDSTNESTDSIVDSTDESTDSIKDSADENLEEKEEEEKPAPIVPGPPKHMDALIKDLRRNYAKSKLILLLTSVERDFIDIEALGEYLDPMLLKKIVTVFPDGSCMYPFELPSDEDPEDSNTEIPGDTGSEADVNVDADVDAASVTDSDDNSQAEE